LVVVLNECEGPGFKTFRIKPGSFVAKTAPQDDTTSAIPRGEGPDAVIPSERDRGASPEGKNLAFGEVRIPKQDPSGGGTALRMTGTGAVLKNEIASPQGKDDLPGRAK